MIKNKKYLIGTFLMIIMTFICNISIKADNRIVSSFPSSIKGTSSGLIKQDGVSIYSKQFDNTGRAFCTFFWNDFVATTCNATWWNKDTEENKKIAVAVGSMINKARSLSKGGNASIDTDVYFYTEMAINYFLYNYNGKHAVNNVTNLYNWSNVSSRKTYKDIYSAGTSAYNDYGKRTAQFSNLKINKDDAGNITATANLTCYNSKGEKIACSARCQKTAKIEVTYEDGNTVKHEDINSDCSRSSSGMYYDYSAKSKFDNPENIVKVNVTFDTINYTSYPVAQEYYCGSANYQNLTPNMLKTIDFEYHVSKSLPKLYEGQGGGDPEDPPCGIKIIKKGDNGQPLSGAKFALYSGDTKIDEGVSDNEGIIIFDALESGVEYTYKEVSAPQGYVVSSASGPVTCETGDFKTIELTNTKGTGSLTIKKEDKDGNAIAGAKIRVYTISSSGTSGSSGQMDKDLANNGDYTSSDNNDYQINYIKFDGNDYFLTTTSPKTITGLTLGETYYVEEEKVPEGSDYAMKVSSDFVKIVEAKAYEVKLINIHSNFKISKQDITSKKELPGAEIHITDIYGNEIEKWTSTDQPHEIKGLADGDYILTEITAPKGYKQAESINFTIEDGKLKDDEDNILVMYDDIKKVIVPDTLSVRNILILIAGLAVIGTGIGIFLYGYKVKRKDKI